MFVQNKSGLYGGHQRLAKDGDRDGQGLKGYGEKDRQAEVL